MKDHGVEHKGNAALSAIERATELSRVSIQVKGQVEAQDVVKGLSGDAANGALGHVRKDDVAPFLKARGTRA